MDEKRTAPAVRQPPSRFWHPLFLHPVRLIGTMLAEHASPRSLGLAGAFGTLAGILPILGLHTVVVYFGSQRLKLNRVVALAANQLGIPPFLPAVCIEVGYYMRHGTWLTEVSMRTLGREAPQRFLEWTLGSLVVGPALAVVVGVAVWLTAAVMQRRAAVAEGEAGWIGAGDLEKQADVPLADG